LLNRLLRKNLFIIGSAAIGSILGVVGYLLMTGILPSDMDVTSYPFNMIVLALFLNSLMIQKQDQKKQRERKELEKFMQEAEREPIKFMEDDILTSAYQEEREYRSMEAYQTPRYY
jgi:choline-glycine betaine transporter